MADMATIDDVALRARVHRSTVSRALNPLTAGRVNPVTRERIATIAKELGFSISHTARSLSTGRSMTIGVLVLDIANPVSATIIRGIDDELLRSGYSALLGNTDGDPRRARALLQRFRERGVDGVIVGTALLDDELLSADIAGSTPIVQMNRRTDLRQSPAVVVDASMGIRNALQWLKDSGHVTIGCIAAPANTSTGRDRCAAFREGYRELFENESVAFMHADAVNQKAGRDACLRLLDANPNLTAVVAGSDLLALGCLDAIHDKGLKCPEDISLIGFDDMPFASYFAPPLTTIRFDHYLMGATSARLMMAQLSNSSEITSFVRLPTELIVRGSTAPAKIRRARRKTSPL